MNQCPYCNSVCNLYDNGEGRVRCSNCGYKSDWKHQIIEKSPSESSNWNKTKFAVQKTKYIFDKV